MDQKNLIKTSTLEMSREDWLAWRQPITHVEDFIRQHNKGLHSHNIFLPNEMYHKGFKEFFLTDTWKDFIFPCIGASEMGAIVGACKWKSGIEVYYEKVGIKERPDEPNSAMFWGNQLEEQIADKWQYWDGTIEGMISNYTKKRLLRKCRRVNFYIQNKKHPWIFCSLDRIINKQQIQTGPKTFEQIKEGVLECKTIAGYYAKLWESGTPLEYIIQIQTQLGVVELSSGELALLIDGREMQVLPFDYKQSIYDNLVRKSELFFRKVKKAMEFIILAKTAVTEEETKFYLSEVDRLAPEPDGSISYENYLKQNVFDQGFEITGTTEDLDMVVNFQVFKAKIDILKTHQRLCSNFLKTKLGEASLMTFGSMSEAKVTWRKSKRNIRTFKVTCKIPEKIEEEQLNSITDPAAIEVPKEKAKAEKKVRKSKK